jgi:hypothetical protein
MVENYNTSNSLNSKINESTKKDSNYDPILDDPIDSSSEEEEKEEASDASSEEGIKIEFPRENSSELLTFIHREITNIQNMEDSQKRKFALLRLYEIFVLAEVKATKKVY